MKPRHHAGQRQPATGVSIGVAVGAFSVETTMLVHHVSELSAADFAPAFIVVAVISTISAYFF